MGEFRPHRGGSCSGRAIDDPFCGGNYKSRDQLHRPRPGRRPRWRKGASPRPGEGSREAQEAATAAARLDGTIGRLSREMKLIGFMIMH
jgi:hypothetical protein